MLPHKLIANVADGAQALGLAGIVLNLFANPAHMDINCARIPNERIVPELLEQLLAAEDLPRVAHKEVQQSKGARLKGEEPLATPGGVGGWIKHEIASRHAGGCRVAIISLPSTGRRSAAPTRASSSRMRNGLAM